MDTNLSIGVFAATILATLWVSYLGRKHERRTADALASQGLSRWLIGLSAGATANSGFVVTAAEAHAYQPLGLRGIVGGSTTTFRSKTGQNATNCESDESR